MNDQLKVFKDKNQDIVKYHTINTMRYMGNKRKLLKYIIPEIQKMTQKGDTVFDLMAGTACVGYALKARNRIISNDIQWYGFVIGKALIENNVFNITQEDIETNILSAYSLNKQKKEYSFFFDKYSDTYFSAEQCLDIDSIRYAIEKIPNKGQGTYKKTLYLTCLMSAMGYAQSTPGHFAEYMPKDHPRIIKLRKISILDTFLKKCFEFKIIFNNYQNKSFRVDWRSIFTDNKYKDILKETAVFYIDPPYTAEQYSRFYHLLDTLILYDYPELFHKGLYRSGRYKSAFCYRSKIKKEFNDLIYEIFQKTNANIVLSYSNTGLILENDILKICGKYFNHVEFRKFGYPHSTQGKGNLNHVKEYLINCSR